MLKRYDPISKQINMEGLAYDIVRLIKKSVKDPEMIDIILCPIAQSIIDEFVIHIDCYMNTYHRKEGNANAPDTLPHNQRNDIATETKKVL